MAGGVRFTDNHNSQFRPFLKEVDMRFVTCLIVSLCFALVADAGPFRRSAGCANGSCAVSPVLPAAQVSAKAFNPLDLTMEYRKAVPAVSPALVAVAQPQTCSGGQCGVSPANRFGRVTLRIFRR